MPQQWQLNCYAKTILATTTMTLGKFFIKKKKTQTQKTRRKGKSNWEIVFFL